MKRAIIKFAQVACVGMIAMIMVPISYAGPKQCPEMASKFAECDVKQDACVKQGMSDAANSGDAVAAICEKTLQVDPSSNCMAMWLANTTFKIASCADANDCYTEAYKHCPQPLRQTVELSCEQSLEKICWALEKNPGIEQQFPEAFKRLKTYGGCK